MAQHIFYPAKHLMCMWEECAWCCLLLLLGRLFCMSVRSSCLVVSGPLFPYLLYVVCVHYYESSIEASSYYCGTVSFSLQFISFCFMHFDVISYANINFFLLFWAINEYIMFFFVSYSLLWFKIFLSDINIATSALFSLLFPWSIFLSFHFQSLYVFGSCR